MATEHIPQSGDERADRLVTWAKKNQRKLTFLLVALAVVAGGVWFTVTWQARKEAFAARELLQARTAVDAGNLPLAANDLARLISSYGGTPAADEGTLLLAQIRLQQGQPELAVATLRDLLARGPQERYRAPAYSILGAALEQAGNLAEAASAYEDGAEVSRYELLTLQLMMEAARTHAAAGDTARAAAIYETILTEHPDAPGLPEVRLRLGEIRQSGTAS